MATLFFIYQNAENILSARTVMNAVNKGDYFQGFCSSSNVIRSFKHDRVVEFVADENGLIPLLPDWEAKKSSIPKKPHKLEICFTGFKETDKIRLSKLALDAGMLVRSSVTGYLDILCCGYNAGAKKIEKAREMQLIILSEPQLINLLETGDLPIV